MWFPHKSANALDQELGQKRIDCFLGDHTLCRTHWRVTLMYHISCSCSIPTINWLASDLVTICSSCRCDIKLSTKSRTFFGSPILFRTQVIHRRFVLSSRRWEWHWSTGLNVERWCGGMMSASHASSAKVTHAVSFMINTFHASEAGSPHCQRGILGSIIFPSFPGNTRNVVDKTEATSVGFLSSSELSRLYGWRWGVHYERPRVVRTWSIIHGWIWYESSWLKTTRYFKILVQGNNDCASRCIDRGLHAPTSAFIYMSTCIVSRRGILVELVTCENGIKIRLFEFSSKSAHESFCWLPFLSMTSRLTLIRVCRRA